LDEITVVDKSGKEKFVIAEKDYAVIDGKKIPLEDLSEEERRSLGKKGESND